MIQNEQLKELIDKYQQGQCSDAEIALLESWYLQWNEAGRVTLSEDELTTARESSSIQLAPIIEVAPQKKLWPRIAGIAAAVTAIAFGVWFYEVASTRTALSRNDDVAYKNDIAPGGNHATLTVNGKEVKLSDAKTGVVISANTITYNDGQAIDKTATDASLVLTTPRGGMYETTLPDGTKIWLNSDSKLELLPNFWNKAQRLVKLSGEAYLEVAKNKYLPFKVLSKGQEITVLGTHFNVSAYDGEPIRTTLLEGSVHVASLAPLGRDAVGGEGEVTLKPNQQATVTGNAPITVTTVDTEQAIAWKNNKFMFNEQNITEVLRMVARWYDVEIVYTGAVPNSKFWGAVSRYENVSEVLKSLESTGKVHFRIEGRKIYVTK